MALPFQSVKFFRSALKEWFYSLCIFRLCLFLICAYYDLSIGGISYQYFYTYLYPISDSEIPVSTKEGITSREDIYKTFTSISLSVCRVLRTGLDNPEANNVVSGWMPTNMTSAPVPSWKITAKNTKPGFRVKFPIALYRWASNTAMPPDSAPNSIVTMSNTTSSWADLTELIWFSGTSPELINVAFTLPCSRSTKLGPLASSPCNKLPTPRMTVRLPRRL